MREFRQLAGRTSKPQVWKICRQGDEVHITWGQLGGAMQKTMHKGEVVNKGKKNERTTEQNAQDWMDRQIELQEREGYREVDSSGNFVSNEKIVHGTSIEKFSEIPRNFRAYKPGHHLNAYMEKLVEAGEAWFSKKRNGNMMTLSIDEAGNPHMFSSTSAPSPKGEEFPWLDRFPAIERELSSFEQYPRSLFFCELVAETEFDDLDYVGSVLRALTERAIETQKAKNPVSIVIWDVAYLNGQQLVGTVPFRDRFNTLKKIIPRGAKNIALCEVYKKGDIIKSAGKSVQFDGTKRQALDIAKANNWEGWVVIDPNATYGDRGLTFHGKAERPKECCKLKPLWDADFILRWDPDNGVGTRGKGKKSAGVGAFFAYLLDEDGEEVFISKVGGGLTDESVIKYAVPGLKMVGRVEFGSVTKDGSLQFPEFVCERIDKTMYECTVDQLENIKRQLGEDVES